MKIIKEKGLFSYMCSGFEMEQQTADGTCPI
jgi:hypothetical protein